MPWIKLNDQVIFLLFIIFSIHSVIEDSRSFRVRSDELATGIGIILTAKCLVGDTDWVGTILGGATGALAFWFAKEIAKDRLGAGDVWFSALIGCSFGFWTWDFGLLVAALLGAVYTAILRVFDCYVDIYDIRIPFAPFMFIGSIAVFIYRGFS